MADAKPFIVAEVSKTWINGEPADPRTPLLCQSFESVIDTNRGRGYRLHSFQFHQAITSTRHVDPSAWSTGDDQLVETIIAVFQWVGIGQV